MLINGLGLGVFMNLLFVIAMSTDHKTESFRRVLPRPWAVPRSRGTGGVRAPIAALQTALVRRMPGISDASCAYRCVSPLPSPSALMVL